MNDKGGRPTGAAFLLAQVGALGSRLFADRIEPLGLTASQSGLLRAIAGAPGRSQAALAEQLGVRASRLVVLVDELEAAGLVARARDPDDRRRHVLDLTPRGRATWYRLVRASAEHEGELCRALSTEDRRLLADLLRRVAADHGLTTGVHPGFGRPPVDQPGP